MWMISSFQISYLQQEQNPCVGTFLQNISQHPNLIFDQCRDPLGNIRSLVSEKMLEKLPAVCKFADNGCQVDTRMHEHHDNWWKPWWCRYDTVILRCFLICRNGLRRMLMIVSTSGGNAPIAAWRSRAKLCFPPRQLCRSCLPTEDTRVKVLNRQSSNKDKDFHNYQVVGPLGQRPRDWGLREGWGRHLQ